MTHKRKTYLWLTVWIIIQIICTLETWYFGWNVFPHTTAEWICDSVLFILSNGALILAARNMILHTYEKGVTDTLEAISEYKPVNHKDN